MAESVGIASRSSVALAVHALYVLAQIFLELVVAQHLDVVVET